MKNSLASEILCGAAQFAASCHAAFAPSAPAVWTTADQALIPHLHTRWLARDGAPPNIESIAQTPDGWLWLASSDGLYRFDGVRFSPYVPPPGVKMSTNVQVLGTLPDGTLWVVPRFDDLYLIKGDQVRVFEQKDGSPAGAAWRLAAGQDDRLWLAPGYGLYVLEQNARQWRLIKDDMGLPNTAFDVLVDREGHWGICGMRERAAGLGASFELRSAPGQGSTWTLGLPARLAYAEPAGEASPHAPAIRREGELQ